MKKVLLTVITLLFTGMFLIACSDDGSDSIGAGEEGNKTPDEIETDEEELGNDAEEKSDEESNNEDSASGIFKVTEADQTDLKIGDTAIVQTSIGTIEITLDAAEIAGTELEGKPTNLEQIVVLDLSVKNASDHAVNAEEVLSTLGVTDDLEMPNSSNAAETFDNINVFEGDIEPEEEIETQFVANVYEGDEYYFRQDPGMVASGTSNEVIWTIPADEATRK